MTSISFRSTFHVPHHSAVPWVDRAVVVLVAMEKPKSRFIIGSKNKQYGLIKRKGTKAKPLMGVAKFGLKPKSGVKRGRAIAGASVAAPVLDVFAKAANEEETVISTEELARRHKRARQEKVEQQHKAALAEDASIFDYDSWADTQGHQRRGKLGRTAGRDAPGLAATEKKSKYIEAMRATARRRQVVSDRVYERKLQREREEDEDEFGDKEKFVTSGYREKLEADRKLAEEEAKAAAKEEDVTKQRGLGGFYRNLLNNNVAFGGRGRPSHAGSAAVIEAEPASEAKLDAPSADASAGATQPVPDAPSGATASSAVPAVESPAATTADEVGANEEQPAGAEPTPEEKAAAQAAAKAAAKKAREDKKAAARAKFLARKAAREAAKKAAPANDDD